MLKTLKMFGLLILLSSLGGVAFAAHVNEECREETGKVSCVDLAISLSAVDTQLDNAEPPVQFDSLGHLLSAIKASGQLFGQINAIFLATAVGTSFPTIDALVDIINKCGLMPHVIDEIND